MKKILFILFFFLLLILIFSTDSKAFTFEYNNVMYDLNNSKFDRGYGNNFIVYKPSGQANPTYLNVLTFSGDVYFENNSINLSDGVYYYIVGLTTHNVVIYHDAYANISNLRQNFDGSSALIYSNIDIPDKDGNILFPATDKQDKFELNLTIDPSYQTINVPVVIKSQTFSEDGVMKYILYRSFDGDNWTECNVKSLNGENEVTFYYYYEAWKNEDVHFRLYNTETKESIYQSVNIRNIVTSQGNIDNYIDGKFVPTPWLTYDYIDDNNIIIKTQSFTYKELEKLEASFAKNISEEDFNNDELWQDVNIASVNDVISKDVQYYFYFNVNNDDYDADGTYTMRFYNEELDTYTYGTIEISFYNIIEYQESINKVETRLDQFLNLIKQKLGFLTYPFELIVNVLEKILNINYDEPQFKIPDFKEPTTNIAIIKARTFNFNDFLQNDVFKTMHDVYLVLVDAFIIFSLVNLARNKLMGVLK